MSQIMMENTSSSEIAIRENLKRDLKKEIYQHQRSARLKSLVAHLLFWIVIIASGLGLINISTNWFSKEALSGIAVIPAIAIVISNTFKYEARSKWNKMKQRKLQALYNKLIYENATVSDISKEMATVLEELDKIKVQLEKPIFTGK